MIRDPSDGTVKEKPVIEAGATGLPIDNHQASELERLQRSRKWLSERRTNPEEISRLMGEQ